MMTLYADFYIVLVVTKKYSAIKIYSILKISVEKKYIMKLEINT